ncbi:MAG: thymidine phosphorylase [Planctomycetes bacterium]|nr:thymidine phosphorylase [Planctomycetota bacterium]
MRTHPALLIQKKRDGGSLSETEILDLVSGVVDGSLGDAQLGAWLMAVCCRGMDVHETRTLTLAMRDSGRVLDLSSIPGRKIDKHSTGGVGDKVSLLLAPLVAACGVPVPMISGRGLGHTGGTIDKLQAIPGYRTDLDPGEFVDVLRECGYVMAGASAAIAPADRRMYAVRDVSGTVESVPLITASILAKKLAEGIDGLVMDVKVGRAAFLPARRAAQVLARSLVQVGRAAGTRVVALLTDMDTPLGRAAGNALEVAEVLDCLDGKGPADVVELTLELGAEMLRLAGRARTLAAGRKLLAAALAEGRARACFARNVARQGGDPRILDERARLGAAPVQLVVGGRRRGFVTDIDPRVIGELVRDLGGGRRQPADPIDSTVGIVLARKVGEPVAKGDPLAVVHARDHESATLAAERLTAAIRIGPRRPGRRRLVLGRV